MVLQIVFVNYRTNPEVYKGVCRTIGYLELYTEWVKLLFTMCITFHLFCFGVFHNNLKKLEVLYFVMSLLVPAVIAAVPLMTNTYGRIALVVQLVTSNFKMTLRLLKDLPSGMVQQ